MMSGEEAKSSNPISRIEMNEDDNIYYQNDDETDEDFNAEAEDAES